ncbi:MAG TPA: hypothetical protein VKU02_30140 [Gemmataceae bacterium]|nr:hypothetical protein [Gemmataceae bacterium]
MKVNKGITRRSMLSVNGRVEFHRRRLGGAGQLSECPVDRLVDETQATVSVGVRQLCCREGGNARSFARGRENLQHAAQIQTGEELFRQLVESEGKAVLKASAEEQLELDWSASDCHTQTPEGKPITRIYASADGVLVPTVTREEKDKRRATTRRKRQEMPIEQRRELKPLGRVKPGSDQRYKQVYVSCFYDQDHDHRLVGVTAGKVKGLSRLLKRESARVHLRAAAERVGIVDGAVCLKSNLDVLSLELILLDFYHASEHVGEAATQTIADPQWLDQTLHTLRHDGYDPFFQRLLDWRTPLRGRRRQVADGLLNYIAARQEMIAYDQCDKRGLDVGSGPMESMCGATTDRIKGRGRRWDLDNAEAMMALEALYQSTGLWDHYWNNAFTHRN